MNRYSKIIKTALFLTAAVMVLIVSYVYGGSSLLSPGTSKISAGDSFDFTLNVKSLDGGGSDAEEAVSEYVVSLSVTPAPASLSVKENVGSISATTGEYQVTSSQLGGTEVLHFTLSTSSDLAAETTYKVSVNVTGSVSESDSLSLVVTPSSKPDDQGQGGKDQQNPGKGGTPDGKNGNKQGMPDMKQGNKNMKMPSGTMPSTGYSDSASSSASVTYAGSWDNYLDKLSVDGYEFTNKFNKIRDTYFLSIPEDVTSLDVSAVPSDSSATVVITGNSSIPEGRSKIMISVTADDGSVRVYRIYVDRGGDKEAGEDPDRGDDNE